MQIFLWMQHHVEIVITTFDSFSEELKSKFMVFCLQTFLSLGLPQDIMSRKHFKEIILNFSCFFQVLGFLGFFFRTLIVLFFLCLLEALHKTPVEIILYSSRIISLVFQGVFRCLMIVLSLFFLQNVKLVSHHPTPDSFISNHKPHPSICEAYSVLPKRNTFLIPIVFISKCKNNFQFALFLTNSYLRII